jgi:hypothetical protein
MAEVTARIYNAKKKCLNGDLFIRTSHTLTRTSTANIQRTIYNDWIELEEWTLEDDTAIGSGHHMRQVHSQWH